MPLRPLTPDEVNRATQAGHQVPPGAMVNDATGDVVMPDGLLPLIGRQVATSAIPAAVGGVGAGATGGALAGLGLGPIGAGAGAIIGGGIAAYAARKAQDKLLKAYATANPKDILGVPELIAKSEQDVREHPYISSAAALLTSPLAGGSLLPSVKNIIASPGRAAALGGIQAGTDIATQKITNPNAPLDWGQVAISGAGGSLFAGKGHNAPPEKTVSSASPASDLAAVRAKEGVLPAPESSFPASYEDLLAADPKVIRFMAKNMSGHDAAVANAVATLRERPGFNMTSQHLTDLIGSQPATLKKVLGDIIAKDVLPASIAGQENKIEGTSLEAGNKANEADVASKNADILNAARAAQVPAAPDRITSITDKGIQQPPSSGEAEASAQVFQQGQNKTISDFVSRVKSDEATIAKLGAQAEQFPLGTPERNMYDKMLLQERRRIDADHNDMLSKLSRETSPEFEPTRAASVPEIVEPRANQNIKAPPTKPPKENLDEPPTETIPPAAPPELPATPPGETPPAGAGESPKAPVTNAGPSPATTSYEAIKKALGIEPKPGQVSAAEKVGPTTAFTTALGVMGADGQRARVLLKSHMALAGKEFKSVDALREAFNSLPSGDKLRIATLYDAGAESYVPKLAEAGKKLGQRIAKVPSKPEVLPEIPAQEKSAVIEEGPSNAVQGSLLRTKVFGPVIPDSYGKGGYVTLAIDRESPGGIKYEDVKNSLPKNLRESISGIEGFRGSLAPSQKGEPGISPAKIRINFKDRASAKAAHDYLSGGGKNIEAGPTELRQLTPPEKGGQSAQPTPFRGGAGEGATPKTIGAGINAAIEKNKQSGAIAPSIIPEAAAKLNKANPIEFLAGSEHALKPSYKVAEEAHDTLGPRFTRAANKAEIDRTAFMNNVEKNVKEITKGLSPDESRRVNKYLDDRFYGKPTEELSPRLQTAADAASKFQKEIVPPDAPWVSEIVNGKIVERPREDIPNFHAQIASSEALAKLRGKQTPESIALREAQIAHNVEYGSGNHDQAVKEFTAKFAPAEGLAGLSPEFAGLRRPAGKGLAEALREPDLTKRLMTYGQRIATDYAWHKNIESDPQLAKGLNLPSNGKGEATPEVVLDDKGRPIEPGVLSQNAGVKTVNHEYTGTIDPEAREFEKIRNIATAPLLGPVSRGRHVMIAQNALREIMTPTENRLFLEAGKKLLSGGFAEAKDEALASGSLRASRNINPAMAADMLDGVSNTLDRFSRLTGAEQTSQAGMVFVDQVARMLAKKRLAEGDTAFLDKFGPNDWRTKGDADALVNHIAANLTRQSWGTYTGKDLPAWLTRGSTSKAWAPFFALSRAPIGRFNTWKVNVYDQAKQGNIAPMLHSMLGAAVTAGMINYIKEQITGRKPQELTWEEYFKLGGTDTANTLFSKAATAGYAGVLSELALYATEIYHNEPVQGFNSPTFILEDNMVTRVRQWINAVHNGETDFAGLGVLGMQLLKDQVQVVRQLGAPVDRGYREEKIARRLGYIPPEDTTEVAKSNPFGLSASYLRGDANQAADVIRARIARGQKIEAPSHEWRTEHMRGPDGTVRNYYGFVKDAQGEEAAAAARARDVENTRTKYKTFTSALQRR